MRMISTSNIRFITTIWESCRKVIATVAKHIITLTLDVMPLPGRRSQKTLSLPYILLSINFLRLPFCYALPKPGLTLIRGNTGSLSERAVSQDPSCPAGFLCRQHNCPAGIVCPSGQNCIDFEGTLACGSPELQWCAVNPTTLEAVGCDGGVCCHGNCYKPGTVCCDFPSIQCTVGTRCNACNPGQTCGNNQCAGTASSVTSTTSSSTAPTVIISSTVSLVTASSSTLTATSAPISISTATTATASTSSLSSSSSISSPTVVPSVGLYVNTGCFSDSITARVLSEKSVTDLSPTGMTVEKCIALAQQGSYTYAGVEYGGECHMGNTLHTAVAVPQQDCRKPCAGNGTELCGDGNRIQIYQKRLYVVPSVGSYLNQGCFIDSISARVLTEKSTTDQSATGMTVKKCVEFARQGSYMYAGVEYGGECYVGNTLKNPAPASSADCNRPCAGNTTEACGDGNRIQIYKDSPVTVPSVGNYTNTGCFIDSISARVLVAGNITDQSAAGMTVEKCIAFAQTGAWKYAGVEYGGECHVGNTLHNVTPAPSGDCNQRCAGNQTEYCGAGNRIQIYADSSWSFPSQEDVTNALLAFNSTLYDVVIAINVYRSDLQQLKTYQSQSLKAKRDLASFLAQVTADGISLASTINTFRAIALAAQRIFRVGQAQDLEDEIPLLTKEERAQLDNAVQESTDVLTELNSVAQAVSDAITNNLWRAFDLAQGLATIDSTALKIGLPSAIGGVGVVTGIFSIIYSLLHIGSGGSQPSQTTTVTLNPTSTIATISSTTSSSATSDATPVPVLIITHENTTKDEFDALVGKLPHDERNFDMSRPSVNLFMIVAYLNETFATPVAANSIVECMALDHSFAMDDLGIGGEEDDSQVIPPPSFANLMDSTNSTLEKRQALNLPMYVETKVPVHLEWLGRVDKSDSGNYLNFPGSFVYSKSARERNLLPDVYVVDSGVFAGHQEFAPEQVTSWVSPWLAKIHPDDPNAAVSDDIIGHGTCMASHIGGTLSGVLKGVNIMSMKCGLDLFELFACLDALAEILDRVVKAGKGGNSVVSMSFGYPIHKGGRGFLEQPVFQNVRKEPFGSILPRLYNAGIVVAVSAGNIPPGTQPVTTSQWAPANSGDDSSPLIVVGAVGQDNKRLSFSEIAESPGKISVYAYGDSSYCAHISATNAYLGAYGTSPATAQVAGLVAAHLDSGLLNLPTNIYEVSLYIKRKVLQSEGKRLKATGPSNLGASDSSTAPLVVSNLHFSCNDATQDTTGRQPLIPTENSGVALIPVIEDKPAGVYSSPTASVLLKYGYCRQLSTGSSTSARSDGVAP
ncbi:hypothetical protein V8C42DRAFT_338118 [Trichoderma barbatum]